ncbi:MAG: hypothetical protein K2F70_03985, partial [Muribaculaceae bacterium]|nr:hypothetical protein [Muribaculaceae bacterium]
IPRGTVLATELMTGEKSEKTLSDNEPFDTFIAPHNAVIWKFEHPEVKPERKKTSANTRKNI